MSAVPKRVWLLMAASVALNLFFLGLFAARHVLPQHGHMRGDFGARAFLQRSGLDEAGPSAKAILHADRANMRERMRALADARGQVREALQAVPFDATRLENAFNTLRERTAAMQHDVHVTLEKVATQLSDAERRRMGDALWQKRGRRGFVD